MERIPIISLSGCKSLTDFLTDLPIPQPYHVNVGCRTLLYEPKLVHDAYRCINSEDSALVQRLCTALNGASADNIIFKDVDSSQEAQKATPLPALLTILEKLGAFLPSPKLTESVKETKEAAQQQSYSSTDTSLSLDPVVYTPAGLSNLETQPTASVESLSESYSAIHIAPLKISLKKCTNSEDVTLKKGRKSRRKHGSSPKVKVVSLDQTTAIQNQPTVGEDVTHLEPFQAQIPVLKISTTNLRGIAVTCAVNGETTPSTSTENLPQSIPTSQPASKPQPISISIPRVDLKASENSVVVLSPKCLSNDFVESIPDDYTSSSPKHTNNDQVVCAFSSTPSTVPTTSTVIVMSTSTDSSTTPSAAVSTTTTTVPVTIPNVSISPASASHPVNHDSASSRRVPDPALSQMFHSAALFHTYQTHGEPEKLGSCVGGGLFDDWLDTSVKTTEPSILGPINDCIYSGSLSGPSSVVNVPSNCSQAPHSVGASADVSVCAPQTPLSVPSNHSSYPTTPGGGLTTVALSVNTAVNTITASPSTLPKCVYPQNGINSPSVRLFDTSETRPESQDPTVEEQTRIAPQGLAAYLPRSGNRSNFSAVGDDGSAGLLVEEGQASPTGVALSPDVTGIRSWSTIESCGKPSSTSKQLKPTYGNASPVKSNGRGRLSTGKPRGGGRRRRTELEELTSWSVNDRAQALGDKRSEHTSDLLDVPLIEPKETMSVDASEITPNDLSKSAEQVVHNTDASVGSSHGAFTEALVERVKRRRQQREMELNKCRSGQSDRHACQSSDISPASTPSPIRSMSRCGESALKATKATEFKNQHKITNSRFTVDQRTNNNSTNRSLSLQNPTELSRLKHSRHKSPDSDTSLSPSSTTVSSMRSSKPSSVSSCMDSFQSAADNMDTHSVYPGATKITVPGHNILNSTRESPERFPISTTSKHYETPTSSNSHPPTTLLDKHDCSSTESHFSPPIRTLFNENSQPPSPSRLRNQAPLEAFIDNENLSSDRWHPSHHSVSPVHSFPANKVDESQVKRRRRVIISDDEEIKATPLRTDSPTVKNLSPRLDQFDPQAFRTEPGSRCLPECSVSSLPPVLQPLNNVSTVQANSIKQVTSAALMDNSRGTSHRSQDNQELMRVHASSRICAGEKSLNADLSKSNSLNENSKMPTLNGFELTSTNATSGSTESNYESTTGDHDMYVHRSLSLNLEIEGRMSSDDEGFIKDIRTNQRSPSNESVGGLASSSQLASTCSGGFLPEPGCRTPSTIAYTHSSAMGDSDSRDSDWELSPDTSGQRPEADSGIVTPNASPASAQDAQDSDISDESLTPTKGSDCSSPSSLSAHSDDDQHGSADDSDEARQQGEELTEAAAALAQFTERLSKILRRVEELDLLRLATKVNEHRRSHGDYSVHSGSDGEHDACSFDEHLIPDAARLTRHELSLLYSESAQVRLSGSMFTIPTGRLVRFLTLLLVNMQTGAHTTPAPLTQAEVDHFLRKRQKADSQCRDGSRRSQSNQLTESILWANPLWASVLVALDCARIALNIIVAPDMPRPLLMEDLIDGVVSVVRCQLEGVVCKTYNNGRTTNHQLGFSDKQLWNFACECVGFRTSQLLAILSSLVRFQPNRFTDNLVIRLTELGLIVPLYCLTSGQSMERDPKRLSVPAMRKLLLPASRTDHRSSLSVSFPVGPSRLWLFVWPDRLQRASLALLAGLYGQYEAHRKLIVDEIFRTLLSHSVTSSTVNPPTSGEEVPLNVTTSPDKRAVRTFRLLSSHWLYKQSQQNKNAQRVSSSTADATDPINSAHMMEENRSSQFVHVHALTALFLSLSQGLIQSPGCSTGASTSGGPSSASRKGVSTPGSVDQTALDNSQFLKDEKLVLASYNICVRHAHYLLSGLLKRVCTRTELDLRPVLDTVTCDLLNVVTAAPVEWPVASTLLCVLGSLLIQHLSQNSSSTSRATDLSSKLIYLDTLSTLALGLKRSAILSLKHRSSLHRPEMTTQDLKKSLPSSRSCNNEAEDIANDATLRRRELLARTQLIGFISSPVPMLNTWLLQPGLRNSSDEDAALDPGWHQLRDCFKQIRLEYADYLFVTAQRFFLASWLHNCTRDLGEAISNANNRRSGVETSSASSSKSASKRVRELEQLRHQLLSELALTHHLSSLSLPWLTGSKHSGNAIVGSSSLSSPSSNKPVRQNSASYVRSSNGSTPSRLLIYGGSFLSHDSAAKRFMEYAHSRHMDEKLRLRLGAHAHWSAWQLMSLYPIVPGFEKLFSAICRLVGESSVPVRTKALRCLAAVIEIDPKLFICNSSSKDPDKQPGQTAWLRDLPRLVHARLLDNSAAVREAAVDLVSKVLVLRPRALCEYYPMLAERVLDKGVSVRKRAIRCFRDLLVIDWGGSDKDALRTTGDRTIRHRGKHKFILMTNQLGVEMCLKLIRRLHDEDSIQKLVIEVFHSLWFTPIPEANAHCSRLLDRRILSLSAVTLTLRSSNFEVLESFLKQILTTNDSAKFEQLDAACVQLVSRLLILIKRLSAAFLSGQKRHSERSKPAQTSESNLPMPSLQGLLASLHLISRCKPELLRVHAEYLINLLRHAPLTPTPAVVASSTNSPALSQPSSDTLLGLDAQSLYHLINVIEMTLFSIASSSNEAVPDHISIQKLNDLQLDLVRLIQRQGRLVVDSALSCLATLTNRVLKDHTQVVVCFAQFYGLLTNLSSDLRRAMLPTRVSCNPTHISSRTRPSVLRALYTVGLMCKHFALDDLLSEDKRMSTNTKSFLSEVVDTLILFAEYASAQVPGASSESKSVVLQMNDADLCRKAMMGLGFLVCRHDQLLCDKRVCTFFSHFFTTAITSSSSPIPAGSAGGSVKQSPFQEVQCIILDNLTHYLMDSERQMVADSRSWSMYHKQESLKELADQRSGHGSAVAQEYLPLVLKHCILTSSLNVRTSALGLLSVILRQGLVHPVQTLACLICLQTDPDTSNRSRATHLLAEAERKVPGFIAMRAASGIQLSYQLHLLLHPSSTAGLNKESTTAINNSSVIPLVRGATQESVNCATSDTTTGTSPIALNHAVYSLLRSNRQNRRSLISSLLSLFDLDQAKRFDIEDPMLSQKTSSEPCLGQLIFVADQLAHFPYSVLDEVLFIAYHVEQRLSVNGSSLIQLVQQALLSSLVKFDSNTHLSKKDRCTDAAQAETHLLNLIESVETKVLAFGNQCKTDTLTEHSGAEWDQDNKLHQLFTHAQPTQLRDKARQAMVFSGPICWLLLTLRHHLRDCYGVTDSKLKDYSPSDAAKQWERPIVLPKRTSNNNSSGHLLCLPTLVVQCLNNPSWYQLDPGPPDTVILYQFIRLRHQLLALEDSSHVTGFLSPNPVTLLATTNTGVPDDSVENCTGDVGPKGDYNLCSTHSACESSTEAEAASEKTVTSAPLDSRSNKTKPSRESKTCKPVDHTERGRLTSATVQTAGRSLSDISHRPPTSNDRHKHVVKSQSRKRHPRSSSTSLSSSSSSSDLSVDPRKPKQQKDRSSNGASHSKTPHTPAKLARVGDKPAHSSSSKVPTRETIPATSCQQQQPPPRSHKSSKRVLTSDNTHARTSIKDAPKRAQKPSPRPSSSSDLKSSSSADESGSNTEIESARGQHALAKHARKQSHESQKRSGKPPGHHNYQSHTQSSQVELGDRRPKEITITKREKSVKSDSQKPKAPPDGKVDSSLSVAKASVQSKMATTKLANKTSTIKEPRPSGAGSMRSLAPLPQAMMQGVHGQTHRSFTQGHGKHSRKHTAPHVFGSAPAKQLVDSRTTNESLPPRASDRPGNPAQSKSDSSTLASVATQSQTKTVSGRIQHEQVSKNPMKPKIPRTIRRLSDSSSLSSDSGVINRISTGVEVPSENQCNSARNKQTANKINETKSGKHHTTSSNMTSSRGSARRSARPRSSSSASVSSASSSDVSSPSSSTTSLSSSSSSASPSSSSMSDSSGPTPVTKANKQRKGAVR